MDNSTHRYPRALAAGLSIVLAACAQMPGGDTPNRHDILTGSRTDGTAFAAGDPDMTCGNWTRSGAEGAVVVGHHDRTGLTPDPWSTSWNSSHQSRGGCSQAALRSTGGDGLFYCFAAD